MNQKERHKNLDIKYNTQLLLLHLKHILKGTKFSQLLILGVDKVSVDHLQSLVEKNLNMCSHDGVLFEKDLAKIHRNIGYIQAVMHCTGVHHIDKEIEFCRELFKDL